MTSWLPWAVSDLAPAATHYQISNRPPFVNPCALNFFSRHHGACLFLVFLTLASAVGYAAAKPNKEEARAIKREANGDDIGGKPKKRDDAADARGSKGSPADVPTRALDRLREKLDVVDDTEWALITERMTKVDEIRRTLWTGNTSPRGPLNGIEKTKRTGSASGNPERDALRSAVTDNLPDAEIKSRLARAHEIHRQNEKRLSEAQANLRAVLSIRQEAVLVMAGLLPP